MIAGKNRRIQVKTHWTKALGEARVVGLWGLNRNDEVNGRCRVVSNKMMGRYGMWFLAASRELRRL